MTRTELARRLSERSGIDYATARAVVRDVFSLISETLNEGRAVRLYGFGRFERVKTRCGHYDVNMGRYVERIPGEYARFRAGRAMVFSNSDPIDPLEGES